MPPTNIEWAHDSENIAGGCTEARLKSGKMDPACVNCYARLQSARNEAISSAAGRVSIYTGTADRSGNTARWTGTLTWDRELMRRRFQAMKGGRRVFLGSMTDLWHPDHDPALPVVLAEEIRALGKRPEAKRPVLITLTKRADRLLAWQREHFPEGLPAWVWPGVTAGCQEAVNERIPLLLQVRAEGPRVVSVEPMTGPVMLPFCSCETCCAGDHPGDCATCAGWGEYESDDGDSTPCEDCNEDGACSGCGGARLDSRIGWVICGGESGQKARPSHPDWFRALRDQCVAAGVSFHFKQWGEFHEVNSEARDSETGDHIERDPNDPEDAARFVPGLSIAISAAGRVVRSLDDLEEGVPYRHMQRIGKHNAGRLLDGRTWNEVPDAR